MDTFLRAGLALSLRALLTLFAVVVILIFAGVQTAIGADVVSAQPLPQPPSGGLTMAWLRDAAVFAVCIVFLGWFFWRFVGPVDRLTDMAAALMDDELFKRGRTSRDSPKLHEPVVEDDPDWRDAIAKLNGDSAPRPAAVPPRPMTPPPPPGPKPHVISEKTPKQMAQTFKAKGRA